MCRHLHRPAVLLFLLQLPAKLPLVVTGEMTRKPWRHESEGQAVKRPKPGLAVGETPLHNLGQIYERETQVFPQVRLPYVLHG